MRAFPSIHRLVGVAIAFGLLATAGLVVADARAGSGNGNGNGNIGNNNGNGNSGNGQGNCQVGSNRGNGNAADDHGGGPHEGEARQAQSGGNTAGETGELCPPWRIANAPFMGCVQLPSPGASSPAQLPCPMWEWLGPPPTVQAN